MTICNYELIYDKRPAPLGMSGRQNRKQVSFSIHRQVTECSCCKVILPVFNPALVCLCCFIYLCPVNTLSITDRKDPRKLEIPACLGDTLSHSDAVNPCVAIANFSLWLGSAGQFLWDVPNGHWNYSYTQVSITFPPLKPRYCSTVQ